MCSILESTQQLYLKIQKQKNNHIDILNSMKLKHEESIKLSSKLEKDITNQYKEIKSVDNILSKMKLMNPMVHTTLEHRKLN